MIEEIEEIEVVEICNIERGSVACHTIRELPLR